MLPPTLILTQDDVERLISMRVAISVIERAFKAQGRGEVRMPPKVYLSLPDGGDFRAMPAYLARPPACGVKWVNVHPRNWRRHLPTVMGIIILNDPKTGYPLAVMDGMALTQLRTGAAAAVAAKALARRESTVVALIGCGAQAMPQLLGLREGFRVRQLRVWGYRPREARRFCAQTAKRLGVPTMASPTVKACVSGADVIVTITPSRQPLVQRAWVKPGAHINAIGADAPGKQELDPQILREATVVVDEREQAIHGGELNVPISRGQFTPAGIHATLGEVLLGKAAGRTQRHEITVFDSTGLAVHDVALGAEVVHRALRHGSGRRVRVFRQR